MEKNIQLNKKIIESGVNLIDPDFTYIDETVSFGKNVTIYPGVVLENNVKIGNNVTIQNYSIIKNNIEIGNDVFIGPYNLIRNDTTIDDNSSIGPHCEITRSKLGKFCKIGHKNFIGDAILYDNVFFGAGAITANSNFDQTFKTILHKNVKIGVNACLIAPIEIKENSFVAAGSTVNKNISENTLSIARAMQINKPFKK